MTTEIDKSFWYKFKEPTQDKYVSPDDAGWLKRDGPTSDNQLFCFVLGNAGPIAGKEIGPIGRPLIWTMEEALRPNVYYVRLSAPPIDFNFRRAWFTLDLERGKYRICEPTIREFVGIGSDGFLIRWAKDDGSTQLYTFDPVRKITPEEQKYINRLIKPD